MTDVLRIKRRTTGAPGAPSSLANAELAYNEQDHILYYGEGTGGAGGTASVIVGIAGQGLSSTSLPLQDATVALAGTATTWSRADHVHPTDTTRAPLASPVFTGDPQAPTPATADNDTSVATTAYVKNQGYATLASPVFTGDPQAPTPATADNDTSIATTAFVKAQGYAVGGAVPSPATTTPLVDAGLGSVGVGTTYARNDHAHPTDTSRAPLASPVFTGDPQAPTPLTADNDTSIATTAFVKAQSYATTAALPVASSTTPVMDGTAAIGALTTYARGDHVHPSDTSKANLASPTFTGVPAAPTATYPNSTTQVATTAFVSTNFAPLVSPAVTGTPTAPTAASGTNTTQIATTAFAMGVRQDQQAVPTAAVSWNNQLLNNLADPVSAGDAATKRYVDQSATGLLAKGAVQVATVGANITLSGLQSLDGYTMIANDRVLVKDQTLAQNNGIYVAASTAWVRATDMDAWAEVPQAYVFVVNGTLNSNSSWVCNSAIGGTLGTTAITWVQFSQAAQVTAGGGMTRTGNSFDVIGTAGRIAVFADNVDIDATYVGQASITTVGTIGTGTWNATTISVARGGSGATTLTGFLKGNGTSAFTAQAQLASTDITGLGTMALQNATAVAITGGTIDGIQLDGGSF